MLQRKTYLLFCIIMGLISCSSPEQKKIKIALSKENQNSSYSNWLRKICPEAEFVNMYNISTDSLEFILSSCNGFLITGGNDVYPGRYGKENEIYKCEEFDLRRDSVEFFMINMAMEKRIPLLGICRGEQILNVVNGGSLFTDIPTDIGNKITHRITDSTVFHSVKIEEGSLLNKISGVTEGNVNSIHHQSIDKIALGFIASAYSDDGVVEAIESKYSENFIMGVQWHPERLDSVNPLSYPIGKYFIDRIKAFDN